MKQEQDHNGGNKGWDGDGHSLLPAACPVHLSRLIQVRVDSRQRGQINDGAVA
ncbi:hypothetical protein D3C81_2222780 [compost metagenome]